MNFNKVFVSLFQFNRTNWKAVFLCFLAASVFWLFNSFNKSYTITVRFPLHFDYDEEKYVPMGIVPGEIDLNVSGIGWDLFMKTLGFKLPELEIPLEKPEEIKKIVGSTLTPLFANQLGGLQVNYILIDTLRIQLEIKDSHKYKLIPDLTKASFRQGFGRISPVTILPDSVTIEGPKSLLPEKSDSIVVHIATAGLDKSFREELEIVVGHNGLKRNPPVVSVIFEVGPVERVETKIPVRVAHMPSSVRSSYIDSVKLIVQIPQSQSDAFQISKRTMIARIDLRNKTKGIYTIYPQIIGLPEYADHFSLDSLIVRLF